MELFYILFNNMVSTTISLVVLSFGCGIIETEAYVQNNKRETLH